MDIKQEYYFTAANGVIGANSAINGPIEPPLAGVVFCVLLLKDSTSAIGHVACDSPGSTEEARTAAKKQALKQVRDQVCEKAGMPPHQRRVLNEKYDLDDKINKLQTFIKGEAFIRLPEAEADRLLRQASYMISYAEVLSERVDAFQETPL